MAEAAALHAAAVARAIKASGTLVRLEPAEFSRILNRQDMPLVVRSYSRGLFLKRWCYLTPYRGLTFFTLCPEALPLPGKAEIIDAKAIWIP